LNFFLFEWRFADWPWNVVILLRFQVPVPFFDFIFGICETCRCETTLKFFADDSGMFWKWFSESATLVHVILYEQLFQAHHWYFRFFQRNTACCFQCCVFCQNDDGVIWRRWRRTPVHISEIKFCSIFFYCYH